MTVEQATAAFVHAARQLRALERAQGAVWLMRSAPDLQNYQKSLEVARERVKETLEQLRLAKLMRWVR